MIAGWQKIKKQWEKLDIKKRFGFLSTQDRLNKVDRFLQSLVTLMREPSYSASKNSGATYHGLRILK